MTVSIRYPVLILFILTILLSCYLGFSSIQLNNYDKLLHFIMFNILTIEFYFIWNTNYKNLKIINYLTFLICTLFGSILSEFIQNLINSNRIFDVFDILYNLIGSLIGLILSILYSNYKKNQLRNNKIKNRNKYKNIDIINDEGEEEGENVTNNDINDTNDYVNIQMKDLR
ncbi:unnamed protein product [Candida verbasci]|uniref:VanZ-like domain-containing protein n=1 Tax=Candida verbasci TaxID=1227364 RepID=A0A9W4XC88_9ASCO|nr:unnamed protein product [Candida verbasci]